MAETKKKPTRKKKPAEAEVVVPEVYKVRVSVPALNVRKGHGYDAEVIKVIKADTVCEIADTSNGWGKLVADAGWICLDFVEKIEA